MAWKSHADTKRNMYIHNSNNTRTHLKHIEHSKQICHCCLYVMRIIIIIIFLYLSFHLLSSPTRLLMFYLDEKISFSQLFFFPIVKNSFLIFNKNSLNDFMISYIWYFLIEFSTLTSIQFMCCLLRQRCPIYVYDDTSMRDFSKILLLFFQVKVALILRAKKYFCFQF